MKRLFVLAVCALVLAACANKPIYQVENHPVPLAAQKLPLDRIESLIVQAGGTRNWKFERATPGHLIATQAQPKYSATVDIYFDQRAYRIVKNATTGMKEKDGMINQHYNLWIRNLEQDIDTHLANAGLTAG